MPHQDRLNIAVFIDFDNIEIGVKSTLGQQFDVGTILDAIKERGEVVTKIAYADWTRAGEYSRTLTQHAIRLVQRNLTPGGDKNGADINLALDALEMAFTHPHINAYVIVGGDSDFLSLVEKLKQYDKKVFVVGGRAFTSVILQRNCHEFIAYENLHGVRKTAAKIGRPMPAAAANSPIAQAFPIVRRALKILADREVSPQTGLLKSTLLQLDSTFSERNYGASSFLDFVEKLSQAGLVQLKHAGRSVMVELNNQFDEAEPGASDLKVARNDCRWRRGYRTVRRGAAVFAGIRLRRASPQRQRRRASQTERSRRRGAAAFTRLVLRRASPKRRRRRRIQAGPGTVGARRPAGDRTARRRRETRGGRPQRRDHGAMADVPAQRQTTAARIGQRVRRTALRFLRARRAGPRLSEGRSGPPRTRSARRPAGVSGSGAAAAAWAETAPPSREVPAEMNGNVQIEAERPRPTERPAWEAEAAAAAESQESGDVDLLDNEPMPTSDPTAELLGTGARRKRVSRAPAPAPARRGSQGGGAEAGGGDSRAAAARQEGGAEPR